MRMQASRDRFAEAGGRPPAPSPACFFSPARPKPREKRQGGEMADTHMKPVAHREAPPPRRAAHRCPTRLAPHSGMNKGAPRDAASAPPCVRCPQRYSGSTSFQAAHAGQRDVACSARPPWGGGKHCAARRVVASSRPLPRQPAFVLQALGWRRDVHPGVQARWCQAARGWSPQPDHLRGASLTGAVALPAVGRQVLPAPEGSRGLH